MQVSFVHDQMVNKAINIGHQRQKISHPLQIELMLKLKIHTSFK